MRDTRVAPGDVLEIVTLVGGGSGAAAAVDVAPLSIGTHTVRSRLFVGTGKYATLELMRDCLAASGAEVVTVAVRRERLFDRQGRNLLDYLDPRRYTILPNTAGCFSAEEALRTARLGRELLEGLGNPGADWVKLEVLADTRTLLPDPVATLEATRVLVKEGFQVLCYTSDDPIMARRLKEAGAASVMPAGSPIGSGQGVLNPNNIRIILEDLKAGDPSYPVIVDAGVGTASDVAIAMELGCDGVLLNTGIAGAADPLRMAPRCGWRSRPAGWPRAPGGSPGSSTPRPPAPRRGWWVETEDPAGDSPLPVGGDRMARLDPASILGPGGAVARRLPGYERRDQQLEMAEAVAEAIERPGHVIVEAGTGVGKSFAYLVPSILAAVEQKKKIVVSTHTIALQEQLLRKDIPFLRSVMPQEFSAVLVKGRGNYISLRRLDVAAARAEGTFQRQEEFDQLGEIRLWSNRTTDGTRSDLDFRPLPSVWDAVQSENSNCLGRDCPRNKECFYFQARRRIWSANLLIVNHALFVSDLALRASGFGLLPEYQVAIFDEAHTLEAVAGEHMGIQVSNIGVDHHAGAAVQRPEREGPARLSQAPGSPGPGPECPHGRRRVLRRGRGLAVAPERDVQRPGPPSLAVARLPLRGAASSWPRPSARDRPRSRSRSTGSS